jgi:phosphatidate cytidylyltransferase
MTADRELLLLFGGVLGVLALASIVGWVLSRRARSDSGRATVANLNARIRAWWWMSAAFALTLLVGGVGSLILFGLLSFLALREYITLTPTRRADHRTLFWSFFIITPLQYYLLYIGWYGMFSIFIPVYAFLFVPTRIALAGDTERFLERAAKIQWGLMICVYCLSHAPGVLLIEIPAYTGENAKLLMFLVVVTQASDVLQYCWGKLCGKRKIAPHVSPNKTVEGLVGGIVCASLLGMGLWWITPFTPAAALAFAFSTCLLGFFGGLTMSAIKRDRGVKDFGAVIEGHGGILDRVDSLCFAAPFFFHLVRYYYQP